MDELQTGDEGAITDTAGDEEEVAFFRAPVASVNAANVSAANVAEVGDELAAVNLNSEDGTAATVANNASMVDGADGLTRIWCVFLFFFIFAMCIMKKKREFYSLQCGTLLFFFCRYKQRIYSNRGSSIGLRLNTFCRSASGMASDKQSEERANVDGQIRRQTRAIPTRDHYTLR